jgi:hypothetical protein
MTVPVDVELISILKRYNLDPNDPNVLWERDGKLILCHRAYEHIAYIEHVQWLDPVVFTNDNINITLLVRGKIPLDEGYQWTFGEVNEANYNGAGATYPWAMAEKRGKDRLIAKLVGLARFVYSEEESEDFRQDRMPRDIAVNRQLVHGTEQDSDLTLVIPVNAEEWDQWERNIRSQIGTAHDERTLNVLWKRNEPALRVAETRYSLIYQGILQLFRSRKNELQANRRQ